MDDSFRMMKTGYDEQYTRLKFEKKINTVHVISLLFAVIERLLIPITNPISLISSYMSALLQHLKIINKALIKQ